MSACGIIAIAMYSASSDSSHCVNLLSIVFVQPKYLMLPEKNEEKKKNKKEKV